MNKAIIFGVNGQDGYYLSALLEKKNIAVIGISRTGNRIIGDVSNYSFVTSLLKEHQPDFIFHLAANSTARHEALFENHETICRGSMNILEAVRLFSPNTKVFLSGSALQFKNAGEPISETTLFEAGSAYAVARIESTYLARYYHKVFGTKVYVGYFFNHDSPLRSERHVNQKIAAAARRIVNGSKEVLELGNIEVKKEFNFAGDIVEAVWILVNQDQIFEAVIGSGEEYSIKDWLVYCFEKCNMNWEEHVRINKDFVPEYDILVSDPKIIKSLGWKAKTSFSALADMMMGGI